MADVDARLGRLRAAIHGNQEGLLAALTAVETHATATTELRWLADGLAPPPDVVDWLDTRQPVGTVYVAGPATLPFYSLLLFALAPALVGNRVVVRPASASRRCVEHLVEAIADVGLKLQLVAAPWPEFAAEAEQHADGMVFCGNASHARELDARLPSTVRLICQGPGVCAFVVAPDADLAAAARTAVTTGVFNNGQDCLATERVYVADEVFDEFVDHLRHHANALRAGPNDDPATDIGPLLLDGAANPWLTDLAAHGRVIRPTSSVAPHHFDLGIVEAAADAPITLAETYCPVLPVVRFRDHRELREMLSLGDFALGLTVFGTLPPWRTLDFGHVAMNDSLYAFEDAWAPFGGHRSTTLYRDAERRRTGPVMVPFAMSRPA